MHLFSNYVHFANCTTLNGDWLRRRYLDGLLMRFDTSCYPKGAGWSPRVCLWGSLHWWLGVVLRCWCTQYRIIKKGEEEIRPALVY